MVSSGMVAKLKYFQKYSSGSGVFREGSGVFRDGSGVHSVV